MRNLIKMPEVTQMTGLSISTIYQMVKEHDFPQQYKIGRRAVAWDKQEIEDWIECRIMNHSHPSTVHGGI